MGRRLEGPDAKPERPGLAEALRALDLPRRAPTDADRPPPSAFPMTRAAKEAIRLRKYGYGS